MLVNKLSVLNLIPRFADEENRDALLRATQLAVEAEKFGYHRYWVAEHHNFPGIISSSTSSIVQYILERTQTMRIGAGGIMAPNHKPLMVAETYGTLATLYGDRLDVGVGRAPGTDAYTAAQIARPVNQHEFKDFVGLLMRYFGPLDSQQAVAAYPGVETEIPLFILGSSTNSARVAAELGLPYAFAGHYAPRTIKRAQVIYQDNFVASRQLSEPHFILTVMGYVADTKAEAELLFKESQRKFDQVVNQLKNRTQQNILTSAEALMLETKLGINITGDRQTVHDSWQELQKEYQPDELMIVSTIFHTDALVRSYELIAEVIL